MAKHRRPSSPGPSLPDLARAVFYTVRIWLAIHGQDWHGLP